MALREFLGHFVGAAVAADRRYLETHDLTEIRTGIEVWESLVALGQLDGAEPETLVDAYLIVSMLYVRRAEEGDLEQALNHLRKAQQHVAPGSFADLQSRMSEAAWLLLRFQSDGRREDLDEAIRIWGDLRDAGAEAGALAAANLGRALLIRHDLTGDPDDLRDGRRLLGLASEQMPPDHPALPEVREQLSLRSSA